MSVLRHGLKLTHPTLSAGKPHILGFATPRTAPDDLLLDLWNDSASAGREVAVDLLGKLYSAALTDGDLLAAVAGGVSGVQRLDPFALGAATKVLRVKSDGSGLEYAALSYADVGADVAGAAAAITLAGLGGVLADDADKQTDVWCGGATPFYSVGNVYYHPLAGGAGYTTNTNQLTSTMAARAGTLRNFYIVPAFNSGGSLDLVVTKNGVATSMAVSFTLADLGGVIKSDVAHQVSAQAGDLFCLRATPSSSFTQYLFWSLEFAR